MSTSKRLCHVCGHPLTEGDVVCPNCGEDATGTPLADRNEIVNATAPPMKATLTPFCPSCGSPVDAEHSFCARCGKPLKSEPTPRKTPKKGADKNRPAKRSQTNGIVIQPWQLIAACVILILVIVIIIMSQRSGPSEPTTNANQLNITDPRPNLTAIEEARKQAEANPNDPSFLLRYANLLHDTRLYDRAIDAYKTYMKANPSDVDAQIDLGVCFHEIGKNEDALREMTAAIARKPDHQLGNFNLGIVNFSIGNTQRGIEWMNKAIAINSTNAIAEQAKKMIADAQKHTTQQ